MDLILDIGNTNVVTGLLDAGKVHVVDRLETSSSLDAVFMQRYYSDFLLENAIAIDQINHIVVSCVVSELLDPIVQSTEAYFGKKVKVMNADLIMNLPFHIPKPYEIGSDLVANALHVHSSYDENAIIIDYGTALTFTIFSKEEGIQGVTIAPGLKTSINALSNNTSKLPEVEIDFPESAIGKNTAHAIQAGVLYGYVGLVREIIHRIKSEVGEDYKLVVTGGLSHVLKPLEDIYDFVDRDLTLKGIQDTIPFF